MIDQALLDAINAQFAAKKLRQVTFQQWTGHPREWKCGAIHCETYHAPDSIYYSASAHRPGSTEIYAGYGKTPTEALADLHIEVRDAPIVSPKPETSAAQADEAAPTPEIAKGLLQFAILQAALKKLQKGGK